jgi:hypothetical protein
MQKIQSTEYTVQIGIKGSEEVLTIITVLFNLDSGHEVMALNKAPFLFIHFNPLILKRSVLH